MEDIEDVQKVMEQLGGLAALGSADLPARIFALWARSLRDLTDALASGVQVSSRTPLISAERQRAKMLRLITFCIERMEMVAATQPPGPSQTPDPEP